MVKEQTVLAFKRNGFHIAKYFLLCILQVSNIHSRRKQRFISFDRAQNRDLVYSRNLNFVVLKNEIARCSFVDHWTAGYIAVRYTLYTSEYEISILIDETR